MKNISKEAYYQRLKELADVKNTNTKKNNTLGTLIDYKRASNGIAYGIVKENHYYFIKKSNKKTTPDVSDFVYINGLANITDYRYNSLSEADKNRNMLINIINEAENISYKKNKKNENNADDEIKNAEDKLNNLNNINIKDDNDEMKAGLNSEPKNNSDFKYNDNSDFEPKDNSDFESNDDNDFNFDKSNNKKQFNKFKKQNNKSNNNKDLDNNNDNYVNNNDNSNNNDNNDSIKKIEKYIGKTTNLIRNTELDNKKIKYFVNSFLSAFKDKFENIEIEDRKKMADKILKVVSDDEIKSLQNDKTEENINNEKKCIECGNFIEYAESFGFTTPNSLLESDEEIVTNLISNYANNHLDGMNDGDYENVALIIKIINPNILNKLENEYGHNEYSDKLKPYINKINEENEEENINKLYELWNGLKGVGNKIKNDIKNTGNNIKNNIKNIASNMGNNISNKLNKINKFIIDKINEFGEEIDNYTIEIKHAYYQEELGTVIKNLEKIANNLGKQIALLNTTLVNAGKNPINVNSLITSLTNQIRNGSQIDIKKTKVGSNIFEDNDPANVEIKPTDSDNNLEFNDNLEFDEEENDDINNELKNNPNNPSIYLSLKTKNGNNVDVDLYETINVLNKFVNEKIEKDINHKEKLLRKYIKNRINEKLGLKNTKNIINESIKSYKLKNLDKLIDTEIEKLLKNY